MSASDLAEIEPENNLNQILGETDLSSINVGDRVVCFQPGKMDERTSVEILQVSALQTSIRRTVGWYVGTVQDHQGDWLIVREDVENDSGEESLWDVNGKEFSVYEIDSIPNTIRELLAEIDHLRNLVGSRHLVPDAQSGMAEVSDECDEEYEDLD